MYFFPMHPSVSGVYTTEPFANQTQKINSYFEKDGTICVHRFLGRDDESVFVEMFCGKFKIKQDEVEMITGFRNYMRADYNSNFEITSHKSPDEGSFYPSSLIRLFPEEAYQKMKTGAEGDPYYAVYLKEVKERLEDDLTL